MVDWVQVEGDLEDAGYSDFEFDTGKTAVPGLSGSWLVGKIEQEGGPKRKNRSYPRKLLDTLPVTCAGPTDVPDRIRRIAEAYELDVLIISAGSDWVRIALAEPN